jgi:hypothetical protein
MPDYSRRPTCRVLITRTNGEVRDVTNYIPDVNGAITLSYQFGQPISGGSVQLRNLPFEPRIKDLIEIYMGYSGSNSVVFTGFITDPGNQAFPRGWTLQFRDVLWIADFPVQQSKGSVVYDATTGDPLTVTYEAIVLIGPGGTPNDVPAQQAVIRLLRDWAGIPEFRIQLPTIYPIIPGPEWILGKLSPVTWSGVSPLQAAQEIYDAPGYWLYCDYAGYVRALKISGAPSGAPVATFEEGVNAIVPGGTVQRSVEQVYNRVIVTGANTLKVPSADGTGPSAVFPVTDTWSVPSPFLPSGKYREMSYANQMIEYVAEEVAGSVSCEAIARRLVAEHSRYPETVSLNIKGDPSLAVGQTVQLNAPRLGINARNFFIYAISVNFGGAQYSMQLTLDGGTGAEGYSSELPEPVGSFTFHLMKENFNGVGGLTGDMIEIFLTGIKTTGAGGPVAAWSWSCPTGTPTSGTGQHWMTMVPRANGSAEVSLSVTDLNGKIGTTTQTIVFGTTGPTSIPKSRKISFAAGDTWWVTPNGGSQWNSETGQATLAVPPIGAGGDNNAIENDLTAGLLATGTAVGASARITKDMLATPSTVGGTVPGPILFMWQHEVYPLRVWACSGTSVYFSEDGGVTFTLAGTPPAAANCLWVVEAFNQLGTIDVLAGRYAYTSFDAGANWVQQLEGPEGCTAKCYVSGFEHHWVGLLNVPTGESACRSFEGDVVTFPPAATPPVTSIRAITMMAETPELFCFDEQGRIWKAAANAASTATLVGTMPDV